MLLLRVENLLTDVLKELLDIRIQHPHVRNLLVNMRMLLLHVEKLLRKERRAGATDSRRIFFERLARLGDNGLMRRESACATQKEEENMNGMSVWIEHLKHPLVLAGFGLFVFALIIKPLFLNNKKLNGTAIERLLHKGMILLFILAAMAVIGGFALSWKATPAATTKPPEQASASDEIQQYEKRLRAVEQLLLAKEAEAATFDDKERLVNDAKLKVVQEKLDDVQKSWQEELQLRKETEANLVKLKGELPDAQLKKAKDSLAQGDKDEAEKAFDVVADKEGNMVALSAFQSGKLAEERLDYAKALRQYKKAATIDEDNPDYLLAAGKMANTVADYSHAQEWLEKLLKIREMEGKEDVNLGNVLNELAELYYFQGHYEEVEPLYKRALAIREQKLGKEHPDVAEILNNLAVLYYYQGHYEAAESLYKRALAIYEQKLGKEHPDVAQNLNNLAALYKAQGKYAEAEPLYQHALAIREQKLGKEHPDVAESLNNLAGLYKKQGKYVEAEPLYQRALAIVEKTLGKEHPHVAISLNNLAELYSQQGEYTKAEPMYKHSLEIREKTLGKEHPYMAAVLNNLARLYESQGRYEDAEPLYKRSLEIKEKSLGKDHPDVAQSLNNLAGLYQAQGRYPEAEPLFQRAIAIMKEKFPGGHPNLDKFQKNYDALKEEMAGM